MTNDPRLEYPRLPKEYVEGISPDQCARYLRAQGWVLDRVLETGEVALYRHPEAPGFVAQVPLTRQFADYGQVVGFVITCAAAREQRPFWEVYMDMAGRYYVGPHTYSTTPHLNGAANGPARHPDPAEVT